MIIRIGTFAMLLLCACQSEDPATGELGRAQFAYCDLDAPQPRPECHVTTPLAAHAEAVLFVRGVDGTPVAALVSEDPSVLSVAPSGIAGDLFLLSANGEGSTSLSAMGAGGEPIDRVVLEVRDAAEIRVPGEAVVVPPGGASVPLECFASDGRRLVGLGSLALTIEGATIEQRTVLTSSLDDAIQGRPVRALLQDGAIVEGPVEGGTGRLVATAPSGASAEVPLEIVRARVESLALSVVETTIDQGRVAAAIELEAGRRGCCEWTVGPAGGPISIRRAECDYVLVESTAVGVPTPAQVGCTVLDRSESVEVVVGVE